MRKGFTLIETLVAVGVIVLLLGIVLAAMSASRKQAQRTVTESAMQSIHVGMSAYVADHGVIPRPLDVPGLTGTADRPNPPTGGQLLVQALIALAPALEQNPPTGNVRLKQDGKDGPGFKTRPGAGMSYGPYVPVEKVRLSNQNEPLLAEILDAWDTPIDYVPEDIKDPGGKIVSRTQKYTLVSAGPDQKYGTKDDIRSNSP